MEKGHYGHYTGNARHSKVTDSNMGATKRDDKAHMTYLKEDVDYDSKHGGSDSSMTSDEKHISKLAGDLKYDEKKHGSAAKMVSPLHNDKKNLARKQEKLSKTRDQVNETYDKKTPNSKKENRKIEKYKKTKSQIKDLGEKTNTFV
jgi:predicted  nucleic acid-binding Zn-ribbon protein